MKMAARPWIVLVAAMVFALLGAAGQQMWADLPFVVVDSLEQVDPPPQPTKPIDPNKVEDPYLAALKGYNIEPTSEAMAKYLKGLHPDPEQARRVAVLIEQLGDANWKKREAATAELMSLTLLPVAELRKAAASSDAEVAARSAEILQKREGQLPSILLCVFRVMALKKLPNCVGPILQTIPLLGEDYLLDAACVALRACATSADADAIKAALKHDNDKVRYAAAYVCGPLLKDKAAQALEGLLADKSPRVRLAAAFTLLNASDRNGLAVLLDLMAHEDVAIRADAALMLEAFCGKDDIVFSAYGSKDDRDKALASWRAWIHKDGQTAALKRVAEIQVEGSYLRGNTLLAYGYKRKVEEIDPKGKVLFSWEGSGPWSAEKLRNGNYLVADYSGNQVLELTPKGQAVWKHGVNCLNAKGLPNGNVLIADYNGNQAIEVNRQGTVVWSYKTPSNCTDIQRLPNGNTLVGHNAGIVEVTAGGKAVWEHPGSSVYGVQRLRNGNTLVAEFGKGLVYEITPQKKVVWEFAEAAVSDAYRLPNGNTLITTGTRFLEVTPAKKIVLEKAGSNYGTFRR